MKRLFLVRHAKAAAGKAGSPDIERPLTRKGVKTARDMARKVKALGLKPVLFVSSPADRALETAHLFARELGYPVQKIRLENAIYEPASPRSLLDLVRRLEDSSPNVFLFGHNPALQDLAQHLVKEFPGRLPKMGVLEVDLKVKSWKEAGPSAARSGFFDYPDREAEEAGQRADSLAAEIARSIEIVLERKDARRLGALLPVVERASRKVALEFLAAGKEKGGRKARVGAAGAAKAPTAAKIRYVTPKLTKRNAVPVDPPLAPVPGDSPVLESPVRKRRPTSTKRRRRR